MRRRLGLVLILLLVVACTGGGDDEAEVLPTETAVQVEPDEPSSSLRVALCSPDTLMPADNLEICGTEILTQLFTPLTIIDRDTGEPVPAAAESIEPSDDQASWTIRLREGWTFHNGEPVTASSFADAWELARRQGYTTADYLQPVLDVTVTDPLTLEVQLDRPFSQFPHLLGFNPFFPLPEAVLDNPGAYTQEIIGNGPFRIVDNSAGRITLARYEGYAGPTPALDEVTYVVVADEEEGLDALLDGRVDVAEVPAGADLGSLADNLVASDGVSLVYASLPIHAPPYDDLDVREALSLAIDRGTLVADTLPGVARPATGLIPPATPGSSDIACDICRLDAARAAELLEGAGGLDKPIVLSGGPIDILEAVAEQWGTTLGVEVQLGSASIDQLSSPEATGPFITAWFLDYLSPQNMLEPLFSTTGPANYNAFTSSDVDAAIAAANAAPDFDTAVAGYRRAQDFILSQVPVIPLAFDRRVFVHGDQVDTLVIDRLGQVSLRETTAR